MYPIVFDIVMSRGVSDNVILFKLSGKLFET